jgi:hypothetical protein
MAKHASLAALQPLARARSTTIGSRLKPHKSSAPRKTPTIADGGKRLGRAPADSGEGWSSAAFAG